MMRDARLYDSDGDSDEGIEQQRGGPGSDFSAFRMTLAGRMPLTIVHASCCVRTWPSVRLNICFLMKFRGSRFRLGGERRKATQSRWAESGKQRTAIQRKRSTSPARWRNINAGSRNCSRTATRERYHSRCPLVRAFAGFAPGRHGFRERDLPMSRLRSSRGIRMRGRAEKGEWIAENPECSRRGFWLNFAVSPFVRWTTVIAEFREACHRREEGDESLFRVVLATRLTQNYTEKVERMSEPEILLSRREVYPAPVPSDSAKVIVAAIDTMDSWLGIFGRRRRRTRGVVASRKWNH